MIEKAIFKLLTDTTAISQIVGSRVFPVILPENAALPAIVFGRVSTNGAPLSHDGSTGIVTSYFEITAIAKDVQIAKTLSTQIRKRFSGFTGKVDGFSIFRASVESESDEYDVETGTYQIPVEVYLTHKEA